VPKSRDPSGPRQCQVVWAAVPSHHGAV
jgi:hypothetical protein